MRDSRNEPGKPCIHVSEGGEYCVLEEEEWVARLYACLPEMYRFPELSMARSYGYAN